MSENELDFTPLNGGQSVIAADTISRSGGVRDPHLLRAEYRRILMSLPATVPSCPSRRGSTNDW